MNCPVCGSAELIFHSLETNLPSLKCPGCGGNWIRGTQYWKWLEGHGPNLPERPGRGSSTLSESEKYLDCPECRFRMVKRLVGHGTGITLDHCDGCKGIWFDRDEWEALKERNLHDDLHAMLTAFWQAEALKEERRKHLEQLDIGRFGADDYSKIKRIRAWIDGHQKKQELLAYLTDEDPLGI